MDVDVAERLESEILGDEFRPPVDTRKDRGVLTSVEGDDDEGWALMMGSSGFYLSREDLPSEYLYGKKAKWKPKKGQHCELLLYRGSQVIGMKIDGVTLFQKSEREVNLEWLLYRATNRRKNIAEYEDNRDEHEEKIRALPEAFQKRIKRLRAKNPEWRYESMGESYEVFCYVEAVKIHAAATHAIEEGSNAEQVKAFWADEDLRRQHYRGHDEEDFQKSVYGNEPKSPEGKWIVWVWSQNNDAQKRLIADLDYSQHSGNTFGAAMWFALAHAEGHEL